MPTTVCCIHLMIFITGWGAVTAGAAGAGVLIAAFVLMAEAPVAANWGWVDGVDSNRGSADVCAPDAGIPGCGVGVLSCNALLWAAEEPNDVEVCDLLDFFAADFGEEPDAPVDPPGDFFVEDFGEESGAWVDPPGDVAAEDFGGESEGSADCDDELPDPVAGVSA